MNASYDALGRTLQLDLGDTHTSLGTPAAILERQYGLRPG
jgi:hypothetical protein